MKLNQTVEHLAKQMLNSRRARQAGNRAQELADIMRTGEVSGE